ncbi:hypothetical protein HG531_005338 [Fusarium graminearum]|nr:hypothetical protein HG531_005338 [Fusarium graminearum]
MPSRSDSEPTMKPEMFWRNTRGMPRCEQSSMNEASHESGAKVALEFREFGAIHNSSNDLADGKRLSQVGGSNAKQLLWVVEWLQVADAASGQYYGMGIIHGQVICYTRHRRVHLATSQILMADNFSCRCLDKRRTGKKNVTLLLNNDALVAHSWDIGTTSCTWAHDYGDLGDTLRAHAGLVIEDATKVILIGENIGLVGEIGAAAVDEVDASGSCQSRETP